MIRSISGVSFGDAAPAQNYNELINSPGKYASAPAAADSAAAKGDEVDLSTKSEEKSHTGAIIGGVIGALALAWIGLGIAVGKGKLTKVEGDDLGFGKKCQNFFHTIGESAKKAYDSTLGKWFGKNADDATKTKPDGDTTNSTAGEGGTTPPASTPETSAA